MPDLIAQGVQQQHRWRRTLPLAQSVVLGRARETWVVSWDDQISRRHVELLWTGSHIVATKLPTASNPVFFEGHAVQDFELRDGGRFVIGTTTFTVTEDEALVSLDVPQPVNEQTFSPEYLRQIAFRNADQRIEVLSRLPEIIRSGGSEQELFVQVVNLLLSGNPRANAAAIVRVDDDQHGQPTVLCWDSRLSTGHPFRPSERLIRQAIAKEESVVHVWDCQHTAATPHYTISEEVDWAFATPVAADSCRGWTLYISGGSNLITQNGTKVSDPLDLRDDVKFTELAATTLGNLLDVRQLAGLSQFLSPVVLEALVGKDPDVVLAPREAEVSVLFCDLRGFSRKSEQLAHDLLGLLERVSSAMGVMTHCILDQTGVVGDFHGDAAMGFWGWPFTQNDAIERACRAALAIRAEFSESGRKSDDPLADFQIGLGLATGNAVAGKLGSDDQVKVTVFGPVVNLASRLENMTKTLRAGILLDEQTANFFRHHVSPDVGRVRRLAIVRPYGMQQAVEVSELLPPEEHYSQVTNAHIEIYENAVDALLGGQWDEAFELLHQVPADDRAKDFLTVFIAQHNRTPPDHWDGVIPIDFK